MKYLVTIALWPLAAILCIAASASITAGLWFSDREYFHLMEDTVYVYSFSMSGPAVPTYTVSAFLVGTGIITMLLVTMVVNKRSTGSYLQLSSRWLFASLVFLAIGMIGWLAFVDWASRTLAGT